MTAIVETDAKLANLAPRSQAVANDDLAKWSAALQGAAVVATSAASAPSIGAMIGARGCVTADGAGVYTVSVAWQGMSATAAG